MNDGKENFEETMDQILVFLSWGRRDDVYLLGDEGDGDDGMLEPNDVFEEELEKKFRSNEESWTNFNNKI
jgi:hypothetical protein